MTDVPDSQLRALIRLLPPARTLKDHLEKSLHLEIYEGTGDLAVKSLQGLLHSVNAITNDPYVSALSISVPENAGDKEKVSLALLAAGQLAAYLEGQTGLAYGGNESSSSINVQSAPQISLNNVEGIPSSTIDKMVDMTVRATKSGEE